MKKLLVVFTVFALLIACKKEVKQKEPAVIWEAYDESVDLAAQQEHESERMRYKLVNSVVTDKNSIWEPFITELSYFSAAEYEGLKPYILEKSIPEINKSIKEGKLTYEQLTLFYIYRIRQFESDNTLSLNAVIALNPEAVRIAIDLDENLDAEAMDLYSIKGMPILIKDNIGLAGIPTTAGAVALKDNMVDDAFITKQLKESGAIILGKANLSEWAYFFCSGCPLGYSALGGQTMNPYGRMQFESGGSSSGSGVAGAANYAVATVGTETSGSILSPSSKNSIVGLKPTIGKLSRGGIVPISSTLDTPGPMTKSVVDNAILLNAMLGKDKADSSTVESIQVNLKEIEDADLKGKRFGVIKALKEDSLYVAALDKIAKAGAELVEFDPGSPGLSGFITLLNIDMKIDLPYYFADYGNKDLSYKSVKDVVNFNKQDSLIRAPYGQQLFEGIVSDTTTVEELNVIKSNLEALGRNFFNTALDDLKVDAVLSINNYHAGYAAVAKYPALTVPMGYQESGEPMSLTFIGKQFEEEKLLQLGSAYEKVSKERKTPKKYQ
ncbi:amidase family protein [Spongiivirga citrea]|uniref:Amidase n=1 Tax=Spongiivirga citrea TaxID=1481457 RepID=A0A6M0CKJ0_9FLAO|nr:amidase family protein [Spongiivirga citrea]NER15937.1 amidase [Spongiivirga citrea]